MKVIFPAEGQVADGHLKYAVIAARYQDQWIFCRHKERDTWEMPGGHRENGEDILETAKRELQEETGALEAEFRPIAVYGVTGDEETSYGMLCFARITKMGMLPEAFEMGEIRGFDLPPANLTYPDIQPILYHKVQEWLNLQSNADELWDVYDENRILTGRLHRRGDPMPKGDYHLSVHIWMQNSEGKFLLTKRTANKGFPLMWESTGGSALAGDDSLSAAIREVKEETGLTLAPEKGQCLISRRGVDAFCDVWLFRQDFDLKDVVFLEGETCGAMYASIEEIQKMTQEGIMVPYGYLEELLSKL